MPVVTIDNKKIEVPAGTTVLKAALNNGIYIPHYCYHPLLTISGNCRMCVVEVWDRASERASGFASASERGMGGRSAPAEGGSASGGSESLPPSKLTISCNLLVAEGMVVLTDTPVVRKMRKSVLEFLLINHPMDCPVCDQAGECRLQDYHFRYSGEPSRFAEEKIRKPKVVDFGPHVMLDDERCILCTRCVRFCHEVSKSSELTVARRSDHSFITAAPGRRLDNPYSLNTVDLCPVGALTSKDFRFKRRVWFLTSTKSICPGCAMGCPIWIDHEDGLMYRWRPRSAPHPLPSPQRGEGRGEGDAFLCDEGRLSYKEWQAKGRLKSPLIRTGDGLKASSAGDVISILKNSLKRAGGGVVGIISAQSSCEEIDAFVEFLRGIGTSKIYGAGRRPPDPSEDNILRKKDKNPNTKYLEKIGISELPEAVTGKLLFVIDTLSEDDWLKVINFKWDLVVQITHDKEFIFPEADVVLPWAVFAERGGTFVNFAGDVQKFDKAFDPPREAMSVVEWIEAIKKQ